MNRYSYCWNNPLAWADPTGHWGWSNICHWVEDHTEEIIIAAVVVAAVAVAVVTVGTMAAEAGAAAGAVIAREMAAEVAVERVVEAVTIEAAAAAAAEAAAVSLVVNAATCEIGYGITAGRRDEWTLQGAFITGALAVGGTLLGEGLGAAAGRLSGGSASSAIDDLTGAAKPNGSFFDGTTYSGKVLDRMAQPGNRFHQFPELVRNHESMGKIVTKPDGYSELRIPGRYLGDNNWYEGYFEFGKEGSTITHRLFNPCGRREEDVGIA